MQGSDFDYLRKHRKIWQQKPVLRRLYTDQLYRPLLVHRVPGSTLEIGSGPGFLAEIDPDVWRTDILPTQWVHAAADAHRLPFADDTFANVIGLDFLHHFNKPIHVLSELARVLKPGGRAI